MPIIVKRANKRISFDFGQPKWYIMGNMPDLMTISVTIVSVLAILLILWVFMWVAKDDAVLRKWLFFAMFLAILMIYKNLGGTSIYSAFLAAAIIVGFLLAGAALFFLPCLDSSDLAATARKMLILTLIFAATSLIAGAAQAYISN